VAVLKAHTAQSQVRAVAKHTHRSEAPGGSACVLRVVAFRVVGARPSQCLYQLAELGQRILQGCACWSDYARWQNPTVLRSLVGDAGYIARWIAARTVEVLRMGRGVANGLNLLVLRMGQRQTCCRGDRGCPIEGNGHPLEVRTSEGTKYHQLTTCRWLAALTNCINRSFRWRNGACKLARHLPQKALRSSTNTQVDLVRSHIVT